MLFSRMVLCDVGCHSVSFPDTLMNFVIGSGPAGVAAAHALVTRGLVVTMLDAGLMLEEKRIETVQKLRNWK